MQLALDPRTPTRAIAFTIVALLIANLGTLAARWAGYDHLLGLLPLFDFNGEANIPTVFSVLLLAGAAALLFLIGAANEREQRRAWRILGLIFIFLALDEGAGIHDALALPLRTWLGTDGVLYFAWVIPYAIASVAAFLGSIPLLRRLSAATRGRFLLAGGLYLAGALGMELVEGYQVTRDGGHKLTLFYLWVTIEELLEMVGIAVFIDALLNHLIATQPNLSLRFVAPRDRPARDSATGTAKRMS